MDTPDLELDCQRLKQLLDKQAELLLLDCREAEEHALGLIDGAVLLPMSELTQRQGELAGSEQSQIVIYCHHGMRSLKVTHWLRNQGFENAQSLAGGIDQWAQEIDPSIARY